MIATRDGSRPALPEARTRGGVVETLEVNLHQARETRSMLRCEEHEADQPLIGTLAIVPTQVQAHTSRRSERLI